MADQGIFVTDFDGTMTAVDFYTLVVERHTPPGALRHWEDFERGTISHFEALRRIFSEMRATPAQVEQVLVDMRLDPDSAAVIRALRQQGWKVVVASAGCEWYIQRLFSAAGIDVEYYSNPGEFDAEGALQMQLPVGRPHFHPDLGVDKAGIVRAALKAGGPVCFAGDGLPDLEAALLVPPSRRFARGALAEALRRRGEEFQPYGTWSAVGEHILQSGLLVPR